MVSGPSAGGPKAPKGHPEDTPRISGDVPRARVTGASRASAPKITHAQAPVTPNPVADASVDTCPDTQGTAAETFPRGAGEAFATEQCAPVDLPIPGKEPRGTSGNPPIDAAGDTVGSHPEDAAEAPRHDAGDADDTPVGPWGKDAGASAGSPAGAPGDDPDTSAGSSQGPSDTLAKSPTAGREDAAGAPSEVPGAAPGTPGKVPGKPAGALRGVAGRAAGRAATAAGAAAGKAGGVLWLVDRARKALTNILSSLEALVAQAVSGGVAGIVGGLAGAVGGFFSGVAAFVATHVAAVGACLAATVVVCAVVATGVSSDSLRSADDDPCRVVAEGAAQTVSVEGTGEAPGESEGAMAANVARLVGVLKAYGLSDAQCAGIVGNMAAECGYDFSQVEGIYDEWGGVGPKKREALSDPEAHCAWLFSAYASQGLSINQSVYLAPEDGNHWPALGFCSWTGGQAYRLYSRASQVGADWADPDFQIAYYLCYGDRETTGRSGTANGEQFLAHYAEQTSSMGMDECVAWYVEHFHGQSMGNAGTARINGAHRFESLIASTPAAPVSGAMKGYLDRLHLIAGVEASESSVERAVAADGRLRLCRDASTDAGMGASTIAEAAASWAWADKSLAANDGTEAYVEAHDRVQGPGVNYRDCGIAVATAVRWSGADADYPLADTTANQLPYLAASEKWQKVCDFDGEDKVALLQPGDVLIADNVGRDGQVLGCGHTAIYTGSALLASIDGVNPIYDIVQASLNAYSPAAGHHSQLLNDTRSYVAYRCVRPDNGVTGAGTATDGQPLDGANATQRAIVQAAMATPSTGAGYCASWVSQVYSAAGLGYPAGNACDQYARWCTSSNLDELKVGMIVAVPKHPMTAAGQIYGHVGIYVGGGKVMHNVGSIRTDNILSWIQSYGTVATPKWGFATARTVA
jgi:cell wall-associated NlpC family hydrolase